MNKYLYTIVLVIVVALAAGAFWGCQREQAELCAMCSKEIPARTGARLVSTADETYYTCCAHCALLLASRAGDEGTSFRLMKTKGYETGDVIDLPEAFFVYGSDVVPCCVPSVLAFASRERAEEFARREGGEALDWGGARATLALEAGDQCEMCSKSLDIEAAKPTALLLASGGDRVACCPHCAFMLEKMLADRTDERVEEMWATGEDGELFRVGDETRFVADSDAPICCTPMVVPCASEEAASAFISEHGGRMLDMDETRALMHEHAGEGRHSGRPSSG